MLIFKSTIPDKLSSSAIHSEYGTRIYTQGKFFLNYCYFKELLFRFDYLTVDQYNSFYDKEWKIKFLDVRFSVFTLYNVTAY